MNQDYYLSRRKLEIPRLDPDKVDPVEWELRVQLAAACRLVHHFHWDLLTYNFLSVRLPGPDGHMLFNPFGLAYDEVTASSLLKIDRDGRHLQQHPLTVNRAGYVVHGAIHEARPELGCIIHIHSPAASAICAMEEGLLPIEQEGMLFFERVAYHGHEGVPVGIDERQRLVRNLGDKQFLILRNHGLVTMGQTVAEAFVFMYFMELACRNQAAILSMGRTLRTPPPEVARRVYRQFVDNDADLGGTGTLQFEAMLRRLDRTDPSYRH